MRIDWSKTVMPAISAHLAADLIADGEQMPVYVWTIDHPAGRVLVDTGMIDSRPEVEDMSQACARAAVRGVALGLLGRKFACHHAGTPSSSAAERAARLKQLRRSSYARGRRTVISQSARSTPMAGSFQREQPGTRDLWAQRRYDRGSS